MRYSPGHRQHTRQKVVNEAAQAIRQYGPDRMGVADLMARAGLTHGGFYAHFKSKDDLVAEAITQMFDDRFEAFTKCMANPSPKQGLATYIERYLGAKHRERREVGCPLPALSGDVARMPAAARKRFEAGFRRLADAIADVLATLKRPNPNTLAVSVLAEMVGALAVSRAIPDPEIAEHILRASRDGIKARLGIQNVAVDQAT